MFLTLNTHVIVGLRWGCVIWKARHLGLSNHTQHLEVLILEEVYIKTGPKREMEALSSHLLAHKHAFTDWSQWKNWGYSFNLILFWCEFWTCIIKFIKIIWKHILPQSAGIIGRYFFQGSAVNWILKEEVLVSMV